MKQREYLSASAGQLVESVQQGLTSATSLACAAGIGFIAGELRPKPPAPVAPAAPVGRLQSVLHFLSDVPAIVASIASIWPAAVHERAPQGMPPAAPADFQPDTDVRASAQLS